MYIGFTKAEGAGNDFIIIDNMNKRINLSKDQISYLCSRNLGIGSDGLILVEPDREADCFMNYYNSEGVEDEMYGNGAVCTALYLNSFLKAHKDDFRINTKGGINEVARHEDGTYSIKTNNSPLAKIQVKNVFSGTVEI